MFVFVIQPLLWGIIPTAAGNEVEMKTDFHYVENVWLLTNARFLCN